MVKRRSDPVDRTTDPVSGRPLGDSLLSPIRPPDKTTRYLPPRDPPTSKRPPRTKYLDLTLLLARLNRDSARFTFDQIDQLVGGLPPSAYRHRSWWANTKSSPQGKSWTSVAWQVAQLDLDTPSVRFRRRPTPDQAGYFPGYLPHWIQVKQASQAVESWRLADGL
jgi:hypothetical protein